MAQGITNWRLLTEESREGDLLEHRPLAQAIANAIRETPRGESLGIALYGAWGQGKSMIGRLIQECLTPEREARRFVFVRIEAWKYVTAWSGASAKLDKQAAEGYIEELNGLRNEVRMRVVMESLLRYFESASAVRKRSDLRQAVFDALERLSPISDDHLHTLLEQARQQLGLETPSTRDKVSRRFARVFSR